MVACCAAAPMATSVAACASGTAIGVWVMGDAYTVN